MADRPRINSDAYGRLHPFRVTVFYNPDNRLWWTFLGTQCLGCKETHAEAINFAQRIAHDAV